MNKNLSLDCKEFDDFLIDTYEEFILGNPGAHYIFRFKNGYGASVVKTFGSRGYSQDLWELCVIRFEEDDIIGTGEYDLVYPYSITKNKDVLGNLKDEDVLEILRKIKNL